MSAKSTGTSSESTMLGPVPLVPLGRPHLVAAGYLAAAGVDVLHNGAMPSSVNSKPFVVGLAGAEKLTGSWWVEWSEWLAARGGTEKAAPQSLGGRGLPELDPAPGPYVRS